MTFDEMKAAAKLLDPEECRRHARVSRDNRHRCRECFCCACLAVVTERGETYLAKLAIKRSIMRTTACPHNEATDHA